MASNKRALVMHKTYQAKYFVEPLIEVELTMIQIPGGTFMMGAPDDELQSSEDERPQHEVEVQPFFMSKVPVTQAQWLAVSKCELVERELDMSPSYFNLDICPVDQISWYDASEFCQRLSQKTNRPYRLPTEAEWEYACRATTQTPFYFGATILPELANYNSETAYGNGITDQPRRETTAVGLYAANRFGLHDMHGNVCEWCSDLYQDFLDGSGRRRVLRGGSWQDAPELCRSASRSAQLPDFSSNNTGFRLCCTHSETVSDIYV